MQIAFIIADSPFEAWETAIGERALKTYGNWVKVFLPAVMKFVDWRAGIDHNQASVIEAADDIQEPVMLIHSQTDRATDSRQSEHISRKLDPSNHIFYHTDWGSGHAKDIEVNPEEYMRYVKDFISRYVGEFGKCRLNAPG